MIVTTLQDMFINLNKKRTAIRVARSFGRTDRKWTLNCKYARSFVVNPEFVAGLGEYGYELILVKKGTTEPVIFEEEE